MQRTHSDKIYSRSRVVQNNKHNNQNYYINSAIEPQQLVIITKNAYYLAILRAVTNSARDTTKSDKAKYQKKTKQRLQAREQHESEGLKTTINLTQGKIWDHPPTAQTNLDTQDPIAARVSYQLYK